VIGSNSSEGVRREKPIPAFSQRALGIRRLQRFDASRAVRLPWPLPDFTRQLCNLSNCSAFSSL